MPISNPLLKLVINGYIHAIPLALAVTPWGFLFGALAMEANLSPLQAMLMSLIIYSGAAQISALSIIKTSADLTSLMSTTAMIGSRHLLYSAALQQDIQPRPFYQRAVFAMLLTDQSFAIMENRKNKNKPFSYAYTLSAGLCIFTVWNISSLLGIYISQSIPNIEGLGLDFTIAATFIAITVPKMKRPSIAIGAIVSALSAILFTMFDIKNTLLISGILGMTVGYLSSLHVNKKTGH